MSLLEMIRGDKATFDITLTDVDGVAVDLTGISLTFTAKRRLTDTDAQAVISKTDGAGITVNADPTTGLATLTIEGDDTEDLTDLRTLHWDIQINDGLGDVRTPLSGLLAFTGDVTHASGVS